MDPSRRAFLRGRSPRFTPEVMLPPWIADVTQFHEQCSRCNACIEACEQQVLIKGDGGYPTPDFTQQGCNFCGKCTEACEENLFLPALQHADNNAWSGVVASFSDQCLSVRGITCRICGDHCEQQAIRFRIQLGGKSVPNVDNEECTACGMCVSICPEKSITITPVKHPKN